MIIVIYNEETCPKTGHKKNVVSHGVDIETGRDVVLPQVDIREIGAKFDDDMGEYVLSDKEQERQTYPRAGMRP